MCNHHRKFKLTKITADNDPYSNVATSHFNVYLRVRFLCVYIFYAFIYIVYANSSSFRKITLCLLFSNILS